MRRGSPSRDVPSAAKHHDLPARFRGSDKGLTAEDQNGVLVSAERLAGRRSRARLAEALFTVSEAADTRPALGAVLQEATRELAGALGAQIGSVWLCQCPGGPLQPLPPARRLARGLAADAINCSFDIAERLIARVRELGSSIYCRNAARDALLAGSLRDTLREPSVLVQPIRIGGAVAGLLVFIWMRGRRAMNRTEFRLVEAVARHVAIAIENAALAREVTTLNEQLERRVEARTRRLKETYAALRRSRAELRAVSAHMERVRETERSRIAREIHDELGQALTGLRFELDHVVRDTGEERQARIEHMPKVVDGIIESVRRIASELRPQVLDDLGLVAALEWQAQEFGRRTGIGCRLRVPGPLPSVPAEAATALFRIFQEMLTNVARHAAATRVTAMLRMTAGSVVFDVRDNGRGLSSAPRGPGHLGLLGMQERAAAVGGRVTVRSGPGGGAWLRVRIPLTKLDRRARP